MHGMTKFLVAATLAAFHSLAAAVKGDVAVRVAKWKGDAKGAVSLNYDDGTDSSFRNVVPELVRRGLPGTFYICCGWFKGEDDPKLSRWSIAKEHPDAIFLGDHTWTHGGVTNVAQLAGEISRNGALLRRLSGLPEDAPLSFAIPGVAGWKISRGELDKGLAAHHEVLRHRFEPNIGGPKDGNNPIFSVRTADDAIKSFDRAEEQGGWESFVFHGVGGDWIVFDLEEHGKMLDELERRVKAGRLWVGSEIDVHKYETERDAAGLKVLKADADGVEFVLSGLGSAAAGAPKPAYDVPLTIVCDVPAGWSRVCVVRQGAAPDEPSGAFDVPAKDGRAVFDLPRTWIGVSVRRAD